jgi:hypothetical protein
LLIQVFESWRHVQLTPLSRRSRVARLHALRNERALAGMHVAVTHRVRDAIDAFAKVLCAAAQQASHLIDLSPVPLMLSLSAKLPHVLDLLSPPVGAPSRRIPFTPEQGLCPGPMRAPHSAVSAHLT